MKEYTKNRESQSRTVESNSNGFRQPPISEILQAYRNGTLGRSPIQRESIEEEDDLTSGQPPVSAILQQYGEKRQKYASEEDEEIVQGKFDTAQRQEKPNNTGLPDNLKSGVENLSGYSMDDVKVHYNSDKPAQLNALAYTQGTNIHVAPGQEKHLPHEAWHVVQQKQGRVQPTVQLQGVNVNDNEGLEKEADVMGTKAVQFKKMELGKNIQNDSVIQCAIPSEDILKAAPKTWNNIPTKFTTKNTTNTYGDSVYTVTASGMTRYAPVNKERAPGQVDTGNPAICYLEASKISPIMQEGDDSKITIAGVVGINVYIRVGTEIVTATLQPAVGLYTFDAVNTGGILSSIHVGHTINKIL